MVKIGETPSGSSFGTGNDTTAGRASETGFGNVLSLYTARAETARPAGAIGRTGAATDASRPPVYRLRSAHTVEEIRSGGAADRELQASADLARQFGNGRVGAVVVVDVDGQDFTAEQIGDLLYVSGAAFDRRMATGRTD